MSDIKLVIAFRKHNDIRALTELVNRYTNYSRKLAHEVLLSNFNSGVNVDDLTSVGIMALYVSIKTIKLDSSSFFPYWKITAKRDMIKYLNENSYQLGGRQYSGISLSDFSAGDDSLENSELIGFNDDLEIDSNLHILLETINSCPSLKKIERETLIYLLNGYSFKEIAKMINHCLSDVYVIYKKAIEKISPVVKEKYCK